MPKEPIWRYMTATAKLFALNCAALFFGYMSLGVCVTAGDWLNVFGLLIDDTIASYILLLWTCLTMSFMEGARMRRQLSLVAVPLSWALAGMLYIYGDQNTGFNWCFDYRSWFLLIPLLVVPTLASLSARHGYYFAEHNRPMELLWLGTMLLTFGLLLYYNREIFGLVPDEVRWRVWNCPL